MIYERERDLPRSFKTLLDAYRDYSDASTFWYIKKINFYCDITCDTCAEEFRYFLELDW